MTKHTPGPWAAEREAGSYREPGWVVEAVPHAERSIALVLSTEANARLIAAAPDLLEALRATVEREQHYGACESCGAPQDEVPDLCPLGRRLSDRVEALRPAAIAKAEGR